MPVVEPIVQNITSNQSMLDYVEEIQDFPNSLCFGGEKGKSPCSGPNEGGPVIVKKENEKGYDWNKIPISKC